MTAAVGTAVTAGMEGTAAAGRSIGTAAMRRRGPAAMAAEPGMAGEKGPAVSPVTMAAGGKGPAVSPVTMAAAGRRGTADVTRLRQA